MLPLQSSHSLTWSPAHSPTAYGRSGGEERREGRGEEGGERRGGRGKVRSEGRVGMEQGAKGKGMEV